MKRIGVVTYWNSLDNYGLFCFWNGQEENQARLRFAYRKNRKALFWNAGWFKGGTADFSDGGTWNYYVGNGLINSDEQVQIDLVLDTKDITLIEGEQHCKQKLYLNGEIAEYTDVNGQRKMYEGNYYLGNWNNFVISDLTRLICFCIGRSSMSYEGQWDYSRLDCYSLKFYSKGLSEEEVKESYRRTVSYHEFLEQQAKAKKENDGE